MELRCVICNCPRTAEEESRTLFEENSQSSISHLCTEMWRIFSKFLGLPLSFSTDWDYIINCYTAASELPFCDLCRNHMAQLVILENQLVSLRLKISKLVSKISVTAIKSNPEDGTANSDEDSMDKQTFDKALHSKIVNFQQNIRERYDPKVVLMNCQYNKSQGHGDQARSPPRLLDHSEYHVKVEDEQPPPFVVDQTEVKIERSLSPLIEYTHDNGEEVMDMNCEFEVEQQQLKWEHFNENSPPSPTLSQVCKREADVMMECKSNMEPLLIKGEEELRENSDQLFDDKVDDDDPLYAPSTHLTKKKISKRRRKKKKWSQKKSHVVKLPTPKPFTCKECGTMLATSDSLLRHLARHSAQLAKRMRAQIRQEKFDKKEQLREEKRQARIEKRKIATTFKPTKYSKLQPGETKMQYSGWEYKKTKGNVFCCSSCGIRRTTAGSLKAHIQICHLTLADRRFGPKQSCLYAVDIGDGKFLAYDKWEFKETPNGYECSTCLVITNRRRQIMEHIKQTHAPELCSFYCHRCKKGFISRSRFFRHDRGHAKTRWWKTGPGCYIYDGRYEFDLVDNVYQCGTCGLTKKDRRRLTEHIRDAHAEPQNCRCIKCGVQFTTKGYLKKHILQRSCDKGLWKKLGGGKYQYANRWSVETVVIDTEARLKCSTCGQTRGLKNGLGHHAMGRHIRQSHINPGSYVCPVCWNAFDQVADLNAHQTVHTEARPFVCNLPHPRFLGRPCGISYKSKRGVVVHQNNVHKNILPQYRTYKKLLPQQHIHQNDVRQEYLRQDHTYSKILPQQHMHQNHVRQDDLPQAHINQEELLQTHIQQNDLPQNQIQQNNFPQSTLSSRSNNFHQNKIYKIIHEVPFLRSFDTQQLVFIKVNDANVTFRTKM